MGRSGPTVTESEFYNNNRLTGRTWERTEKGQIKGVMSVFFEKFYA